MVTVPPGTENGTTVRLAGLGKKSGNRTGDITLEIMVEG
jgi:DnaJ-class molecular chaperone